MPDLIARLSGLHATLTTRLALQDSLLALNGRLDMVLSQIEMRSSVAPAPLAIGKAHKKRKQAGVKRYVEGESEDDEQQMDVDIEAADSDASVEDIQLGAEDSEDEDSDDSLGSGDEDESGSDGSGIVNGFIDDEAEEDSDDDDEESE